MRLFQVFPIALILTVFLYAFAADARTLEVRVGIYQNPPLVFQDEAGVVQGFYPDLLRAAAAAEDWSLTFVPGTFSEGLERLRRGEIDLMTAIAILEERKTFIDFSRQNVLTMWSEVLSSPDREIHSLVDLDGKRVAVMSGDNNAASFVALCREFGVVPQLLELEDFSDVLQSIVDGKTEAGVVSKLFAATQRQRFGLTSTGIIFNPFSLHFAAPKGLGGGVLEVLDRHLYNWQNNDASVYYESLELWLGFARKSPSLQLPTWLYPLVFGLTVSLLAGVAWVVTLRRKVRHATAEIAARELLTLARKNLLQQIVDNMPVGIWLSDADGNLQLENPAGQKIWGRKGLESADHFDEMRAWWADSGKPLAKDDWGLVRALRDGQACLEERIEIEAVDGQRKIILASAVPLYDDQGRITGGLEIEQDITEHRRDELAVADLARTWQETFNAVSDAIVILDGESRIVQYNRAFEALVGQQPADILGQVCCELIHGTGEMTTDCVLKRMQESGKSETMTLQKDNRWWAVRVDPLFDEAGYLSGAIQVFTDITQSKEFGMLLSDERQALEMVATGALLNETLDKIALNMEVHIQAAFCSILLISDDGTSLRHGSSPGLPPEYRQIVEGVAIGPEVDSSGTAAYLREMVIATDITSDKRWEALRVLLLSHGVRASWSLPVLDAAGEPLAVLTIYCREPRAPLAKELELAERGVHLLQVFLERRKREQERQELITLLEQRNVELEQFTYTVSHDLKTPLVTIGGFVGQLREDLKSGNEDCVAIDLDFIESAVKTMSNLLANLLNLARTGRAISEPQPVDLKHVVTLSLDFVSGDLSGIVVQQNFPDELPIIHGDPERLREALQNLLENAAKFCREVETPEIQVGCRVEDEQILCWVSDNGIGIAPKYHTKIFDLFEKLDASRVGTGIGLAVSRRIVEIHGGRLWVESEGLGKGSTFFVALPIRQG